MSGRRQSDGEGATGGESAVVLGDALQQAAQGLVRLQEAFQQTGQEVERRLQGTVPLQEAECRLLETIRQQEEEAGRRLQEAMQRQEQEAERRLQEALQRQEQEAERRLQEAMQRQEQEAQRKLQEAIQQHEQEAERRLQEVIRQQKQEAQRMLQEAIRKQEQEAQRRLQEAIRQQEEKAERRLQEALRLQEKRAAVALRQVVGQLESKRQVEDDAIHTPGRRVEGSQQRLAVAEGGAESEDEGGLRRLLDRMQEVEASFQRTIQEFFPRVDGLLRQLGPASSAPSPSTLAGDTSRNDLSGRRKTFTSRKRCAKHSPAFPYGSSPSCSDNRSHTTETGRQEAAGAGPSALAESEALQRQRVEHRMQKTKRRMMAARADPSQQGEDIHKAIAKGNVAEVRRLLDAGVDVNYVDSNGVRPLDVALQSPKREELVGMLLRRGADANAVSDYGSSAMHWAASNDRSGRCVDLLVAAGADVNARNRSGATPLHAAAYLNNEGAVRALLSAGARRDVRIWDGPWESKTPCELARSTEIANILRS